MVSIVGTAQSLIKQTTCKNCASILEYTESEVKTRTGKDYDGGTFVVKSIDCPRCQNEVVVRSY